MVTRRGPSPAVAHAPDPRLIASLAGRNADDDRALALRTRRAVYMAARNQRADRAEGQRNLSLALLSGCVLALMLMPAIWSGLQDMISGAAVTDLPVMVGALGITMLAAVVAAALFLFGGDERQAHHRRNRR